MDKTGETLINLIGSEVCGNATSAACDVSVSDACLFDVYNMAKAHDVAHLAASALVNSARINGRTVENLYREQIYETLYRYENQCFVFEKVCGVLEKAKIPYIPLKGAVLRDLYPQPWMRTGCDIDILVHESDVERASKSITESLRYEQTRRGVHDIQILSAESIYVELHFSLLDEDTSAATAKLLNKAWEYARPVEGNDCKYEFNGAMFYFYHIAHMAKHFLGGGCGIRPFLDLWLMQKNKEYDTEETKALLKKGKLTEFEAVAKKLSKIWFSDEEHDRTTQLMEEFIFRGGCFGSDETKMLSGQQKSGGRIKYIMSRIFIPFDELKGTYPIIKKYRFLTPVCEICRFFSLLFGKRRKFRKTYIGNLMGVTNERLDDIYFLFESLGLN